MDWITVIWSAAAGASLILGLTQFVVWFGKKYAWENFWLAITAASVIGLITCEMLTMRTQAPADYANIVRLGHLIYFFTSIGILGIVHCHFGTGKRWLLIAAVALRAAAVVANFTTGSSLHFRSIESLEKIEFLGQSISIVGKWEPNPWVVLGQFASLTLLAYIINASWRMWRLGTADARRRAATIGGSLSLFIIIAAALSGMVSSGILRFPLHVSMPFFCMVLAMSFELGREVLRSDRLAQKLRANQQELAHLSRVSVLSELAGALAHEINQPLAAILSNAQVGSRGMQQGKTDLSEINAILDDIAADAKRAGGVIHGMRAMLKKEPTADKEPLPVNSTVRQVLALLQGEVNNRKVMLELNLDESIPSVRFNRVEFQQVFINLIMNSLDAMKSDSQRGCLKISTFRDVSQIVVSVRDNGHGIAPETMPQLFDAFFSTKPGGLGLGLSISQSITENAGGELRANNHPEGGAEFQIRIPIALDSYHASAP